MMSSSERLVPVRTREIKPFFHEKWLSGNLFPGQNTSDERA